MAERKAEDGPDELHRLRNRMAALEQRVAHNEVGTLHARVVAGGLGAGAMALLLSLSLPWVRGGGFGPSFDEDGELSLGSSARSVGTGWELLSTAFDDGWWLLVTGLVAVLLTAALAFAGLFGARRGVHVAVQAAGLTLPVLLLLAWPHGSDPEAGGGPMMAAAAGVVVALASFWAVSEIDRTAENRAVWERLGRQV
ncbi:hypothetical protein [Nocardiopsis sp. NRRL B-16309]|uniref:hypothetical protein n=1 Tax=Nocardiopsis sp. NRRL B-16309 TaxID=1519494 RepID=UPI0006B05073|nr:hypothetical protein [Nocardiopsis sp. NRRL B-16309]KOX14219.1 hypothetical protein ADL05_16535 [Nocardiopsis sp. NRRL B-16309]